MNAIDLKGRIAIVTGGARGIGFAIAQRMLRSGAQVALWDIDAAAMNEAARPLQDSGWFTSGLLTSPTTRPWLPRPLCTCVPWARPISW